MSIEAHNYAVRLRVGHTLAKYVLGRLADRADERFTCFPSVALLAAEAEKSERSVQRALDVLRDLRYISDREAFRPDGSQTTSRYQLHGPWDDYAGTGVPFPEIVTPKQARAELWAQAPEEGQFRAGTAAFVALEGDKSAAKESAERAAAATARAEAAKESLRARGRKAAAAKRTRAEATEEGCTPPTEGVPAGNEGATPMSPPPPTPMSPPPVTLTSPLESSATTHSSDDAPPARSANDARRASTGSRDAATRGSAASGKSRHRLTKAEYEAIKAVRALLPDDLEAKLPVKTPTNLGAAILAALATGSPFERTPAQLVEYRVLKRWNGFWARKFYAGELSKGPAGRPSVVGPLLAMLKHQQECGDISCEDRVNIHTGEPCRACETRREDRRADRQQEATADDADDFPQQRPELPLRECHDCGRPIRSAVPALCRDCCEDARA